MHQSRRDVGSGLAKQQRNGADQCGQGLHPLSQHGIEQRGSQPHEQQQVRVVARGGHAEQAQVDVVEQQVPWSDIGTGVPLGNVGLQEILPGCVLGGVAQVSAVIPAPGSLE
ncbi:hypothetical protein D3C72_1717810 [compost metagenome]